MKMTRFSEPQPENGVLRPTTSSSASIVETATWDDVAYRSPRVDYYVVSVSISSSVPSAKSSVEPLATTRPDPILI